MSAAQALSAARAVGIHLEVDGDDLLLEAPAPPPSAILEVLSQHKAEIVAVLRPGPDGWSADDWQVVLRRTGGNYRVRRRTVAHRGRGSGARLLHC